VEKDLPSVLRGRTLEEVGWLRPDPLTLLIPLAGTRANGIEDPYVLRLRFGYYPEWPPSALFVNPDTREYAYPGDLTWLPSISGTPEIQIHANHNPIGQLICASVTLEFYLIRHGVQPEHVWDPARHNFAVTLNAVTRGLRPPFYQGPQRSRQAA
jgi:hypothetical protein